MQANDGLASVAEAACVEGETIHNMPFEIQPGMLRRATLEGEARLSAVAHGRRRVLPGD